MAFVVVENTTIALLYILIEVHGGKQLVKRVI